MQPSSHQRCSEVVEKTSLPDEAVTARTLDEAPARNSWHQLQRPPSRHHRQPRDPYSARANFRLLWAGQTVSVVGDQMMTLTLPLLAVTVLGVTPAAAILLSTALFVPFLFLGLPAGAIVERLPRRKVMLLCNLTQLALAGTIWLLAEMSWLVFPVLLVLVLLMGCAVVFFQVAYTAYVPSMFDDPRDLHQANARLALSESGSLSVGPLIAGLLIRLIGLVNVVGLNALSFAVSVATLGAIRHHESTEPPPLRRRGWLVRDIREGLAFVARHPAIQPIFACSTVYSMMLAMVEATLVLYCLKVLGLSPELIGVVVGVAAAGYPLGNLATTRLRRRVGPYRALALSAAVSVVGILMMPTFGSIGGAVGICGLIAGSIVHCIGEGSYNPMSLTIRQLESPREMLTRIGSVQRFFVWGGVSLGTALAAGSTATFGLQATMWAGAFGTVLCLPALLRKQVRQEVIRPSSGMWG